MVPSFRNVEFWRTNLEELYLGMHELN